MGENVSSDNRDTYYYLLLLYCTIESRTEFKKKNRCEWQGDRAQSQQQKQFYGFRKTDLMSVEKIEVATNVSAREKNGFFC